MSGFGKLNTSSIIQNHVYYFVFLKYLLFENEIGHIPLYTFFSRPPLFGQESKSTEGGVAVKVGGPGDVFLQQLIHPSFHRFSNVFSKLFRLFGLL